MGWLIGGGVLLCCLAIPLVIRFVKQRRAKLSAEGERPGRDKDEE